MHETTAAGEWIKIWLSPIAQLLFDVAFAVLFLAAIQLLSRGLRRLRRTRSTS